MGEYWIGDFGHLRATFKQNQSLVLGDSFIMQTCIYAFKQDESTCDIGTFVMSSDRNSGQMNLSISCEH